MTWGEGGYYAVFIDRDRVGYVMFPGGCVHVLFSLTVARWAMSWWVCTCAVFIDCDQVGYVMCPGGCVMCFFQ